MMNVVKGTYYTCKELELDSQNSNWVIHNFF